jgi:hypothetical protein
MAKGEPERLRRGKEFHRLVQEEWVATAQGDPRPERYVKRLTGRRGRVDILVQEAGDDMVAVVEIKATDWDRMTDRNVVRNVRRQIRQVWSYVEGQLEIYKQQVCPGIIFPRLPKDPERTRLIEGMFLEEGIVAVWHDESIEDMQKRTAAEERRCGTDAGE